MTARVLTRLYRSGLIALARFKVFNVTVHNREIVPRKGRVIIACNHISVADPVYLWGAMRRSTVAMAMAELWKIPGVNLLVSSIGHIPIIRGDKESGKKASNTAELTLNHEGALIIFPEAKCSKDGRLLPFKPGVALLSFATNTPVIPVAVTGTNEVKPLKSLKLNRRAHVDVRFGTPLRPSDFSGPDKVDQLLARLAEDIESLRSVS